MDGLAGWRGFPESATAPCRRPTDCHEPAVPAAARSARLVTRRSSTQTQSRPPDDPSCSSQHARSRRSRIRGPFMHHRGGSITNYGRVCLPPCASRTIENAWQTKRRLLRNGPWVVPNGQACAVYSIMGAIESARLDDDGESTRRLEAAARGDGAAWARCWRSTASGCGGWWRCAWTAGSRGELIPPT